LCGDAAAGDRVAVFHLAACDPGASVDAGATERETNTLGGIDFGIECGAEVIGGASAHFRFGVTSEKTGAFAIGCARNGEASVVGSGAAMAVDLAVLRAKPSGCSAGSGKRVANLPDALQ
jgi:hypothetical protein